MPYSDSSPLTATPLVGFAAFSGTGKTTLLEKLIPELTQSGLRIAVIKASHHDIDPDTPGKDSYRLRQAGSYQLVLSTPSRSICYTERTDMAEPSLEEQLALLDHEKLDLILVEGFRDAAIPKIELHRRSFERPLLHPDDPHIIAIAWDCFGEKIETNISQLDINDPAQIAQFISEHILSEPPQ